MTYTYKSDPAQPDVSVLDVFEELTKEAMRTAMKARVNSNMLQYNIILKDALLQVMDKEQVTPVTAVEAGGRLTQQEQQKLDALRSRINLLAQITDQTIAVNAQLEPTPEPSAAERAATVTCLVNFFEAGGKLADLDQMTPEEIQAGFDRCRRGGMFRGDGDNDEDDDDPDSGARNDGDNDADGLRTPISDDEQFEQSSELPPAGEMITHTATSQGQTSQVLVQPVNPAAKIYTKEELEAIKTKKEVAKIAVARRIKYLNERSGQPKLLALSGDPYNDNTKTDLINLILEDQLNPTKPEAPKPTE